MSLCAVLGVSALPPTLDYTPVLRALRKPPDTVAVMVRLLQRDDAPLSDTELREYSEQLRLAGASTIVLKGDARALDVLLEEQAGSAGEYPGPCPVLFEAAGSSGVAGCRAQALVARSGTVAAGAAEASSLPLVPLAATAAELQEALATPSPLILSSAAAWAELPAPGASDGARADAAAGEAEGSRVVAELGEAHLALPAAPRASPHCSPSLTDSGRGGLRRAREGAARRGLCRRRNRLRPALVAMRARGRAPPPALQAEQRLWLARALARDGHERNRGVRLVLDHKADEGGEGQPAAGRPLLWQATFRIRRVLRACAWYILNDRETLSQYPWIPACLLSPLVPRRHARR